MTNDTWRKTRTPIGIDIGTAAVKVAQWDKGRARFGVAEVAPGAVRNGKIVDHAAAVDALRTALRRAGVKRTTAVIGVGGSSITARNLSFPEMSPEELREAVRWELAGSLGFDPADAVVDYLDVEAVLTEAGKEVAAAGEAGQESFSPVRAAGKDVLAVAVEETVVAGLIEVALDCALEPLAVDIRPAALARILWVLEGGTDRNVAIIDIGASATEVSFFRTGNLTVFRSVPIGVAAIAGVIAAVGEPPSARPDEEAAGPGMASSGDQRSQLAAEITRSVNFFRAQSRWEKVDVAFLVGGGAGIGELPGYLAAASGLDIQAASTAAKVPRLLPPEVFGALGLALWEEASRA